MSGISIDQIPEALKLSDLEMEALRELITHEDKNFAKEEMFTLIEGIYRTGMFHVISELKTKFLSLTSSEDPVFMEKASVVVATMLEDIIDEREAATVLNHTEKALTKTYD